MQTKKISFGLQCCRTNPFMATKEKICILKLVHNHFLKSYHYYRYIVTKNIQLGMYTVNRNVSHFYILFYRVLNKMIISGSKKKNKKSESSNSSGKARGFCMIIPTGPCHVWTQLLRICSKESCLHCSHASVPAEVWPPPCQLFCCFVVILFVLFSSDDR